MKIERKAAQYFRKPTWNHRKNQRILCGSQDISFRFFFCFFADHFYFSLVIIQLKCYNNHKDNMKLFPQPFVKAAERFLCF